MDADKLFPKGFHHTSNLNDASGIKFSNPRCRRDVGYVKYYFIDFDISSMFPMDAKPEDKLAIGANGQDTDVPELSWGHKYDPFKVDIFIVGNVIQKFFIDVSTILNSQYL